MLKKKAKIYLLIVMATLLFCSPAGLLAAIRLAQDGIAASQQVPAAPADPDSVVTTGSVLDADPSGQAVSQSVADVPVFPDSVDNGCDIVLMVDSSDGIRTADPLNYRIEAAKLFISLLGTDDRIGVMRFGDAATLLIPLTQNTEQNRPALFNAIERPSSTERSANLYDAVKKGFEELKTSSRRERILVVISAGKLALGSKDRDDAAVSGLKSLLPELVKARIKVHTVAFPPEADRVMLEDMARETGGLFQFSGKDKDAHLMFFAIFETIKVPDAVPFVEDAFTTDGDMKEVTVLVAKKPGASITLAGPSGKEHTARKHAQSMAWYASAVYDMITIATPPAGTWRVNKNRNEGNKVYIMTDLNIKSSFHGNSLSRGEAAIVDAWIEKQGRIVTGKDVLDVASFEASLTGPGGRIVPVPLAPAEKPAGSLTAAGKFSGRIAVDAPGDYCLTVLARGKTFTRERAIPFNVVEPPLAANPSRKSAGGLFGVRAPAIETFSWLDVLIRFGMVNLAAIAMAAVVYCTRMMIMKMRARQ